MTLEYDRTIQDLLDWNICERNTDGELKPTPDFLVWYYDYLIHDITEIYGTEWEETITGEETEKDWDEIEKRDAEKEEFVQDAIRNQIVSRTLQKIGRENHVINQVKEHTEIVYRLINEINERLMEVHMIKAAGKKVLKQSDFIPPEDRLIQIRNELQKDVELIQGKKLDEKQVADMERKKEEAKGQKKMSEYSETNKKLENDKN